MTSPRYPAERQRSRRLADGASLSGRGHAMGHAMWGLARSRQVRFHPSLPNVLASCAQDGLVNIYSLTDAFDEEESIESVLSTGQTPDRIGFFGPSGEHFYCTTHVNTFAVWDPIKVTPWLPSRHPRRHGACSRRAGGASSRSPATGARRPRCDRRAVCEILAT